MRPQKRHQRRSRPRNSPQRLGPLSSCAYAVEYLDAALAMPATDRSFKPVQTYLACHAIELALSTYLALHGNSIDRLARSRYRFDLSGLLKDAESCGLGRLARLTQAQRKQIRRANQYYSEMVFQYPNVAEAIRGYPDAPNVPTLLAAATMLVERVKNECGLLLERSLSRASKRR